MNIDQWIQFGILLSGFLVLYFMLRKDNRKSNEESFEKILENTITDLKEKADIERRVSLLEQRVNTIDSTIDKTLCDMKSDLQRELDEIKKDLNKLFDRINNHITNK